MGRLVGFCKAVAYHILLDHFRKVRERMNVKFCDSDVIILQGAGDGNEMIDFDMSNEDIYFDDQSARKKEGEQNKHYSDGDTRDARMDDVQIAESDHAAKKFGLKILTYYPKIRRSEKRSAGKAPNRYGFEVVRGVESEWQRRHTENVCGGN